MCKHEQQLILAGCICLPLQMLELINSYLREREGVELVAWVPVIRHMFIIQSALLRSTPGWVPSPQCLTV